MKELFSVQTAERSSKQKHRLTRKKARVMRIFAHAISLCLLALTLLVSIIYKNTDGYKQKLDLSEFSYVGRDGEGQVKGILDVEAILAKLRLPSPSNPRVKLEKYPDVKALCSMTMTLSYTDDKEVMRVNVSCDVETLEKYDIVVEKLEWLQSVKGAVVDESEAVGPSPSPTVLSPTTTPTVSEQPKMNEGRLTRLLDNNDNGINLRNVCQRVHDERDSLCKEIFGNNYSTTKTQVYFIVDTQADSFSNIYRAVYMAEEKAEEGVEPATIYFTVDIYNLEWTAEQRVGFGRCDVNLHSSMDEARRLGGYSSERYTVDRLYDGGVVVRDKNLYDQNGFVRFDGYASSYMMANGIMWSPSYDELTEDMIWSLTAVQGHSLANVLRYVRKEINARYYMAFSETAEAEFYNHFNQYSWYEARDPDWEARMSETEKQNIRLLREIQSLVEN